MVATQNAFIESDLMLHLLQILFDKDGRQRKLGDYALCLLVQTGDVLLQVGLDIIPHFKLVL